MVELVLRKKVGVLKNVEDLQVDQKENIRNVYPLQKQIMTESQRRSAVARKRSKAQGVGGKPTNVATFAKRKKAMNGGVINMTRMVNV